MINEILPPYVVFYAGTFSTKEYCIYSIHPLSCMKVHLPLHGKVGTLKIIIATKSLLIMNPKRICSYLIFRPIIITGCLITIQACTTTKIVSKYDCNTFANNTVYSKTTWSFAWGLVQPKDIDAKCERTANHLNKVVVKNNLGFALISVATLGIVMPQRLEWCCAPPNPVTDTLGRRP